MTASRTPSGRPSSRRPLAKLSWPEVAERAGRTILAIPIGSTEQHGPHLPLSTDTTIAVELSRRLAIEVPEVLVAPPIHFTSSGEHSEFPGTLSIGRSALELLLVELCRSSDAFGGVLLVSTHGGNQETVDRAVTRLRAECRNVARWSPKTDDPTDSHAGRFETSCLLAIQPESVRQDRFEPGNTSPISELMPRLRRSGISGVSPSGVLGDPTGASASLGAELLDRWTADLVLTARANFPAIVNDSAGRSRG